MPLSKLLLDLANGAVEEAPCLRRKPSEGLALEVPGRCKLQDTAPQTFWRRAAIDPFPECGELVAGRLARGYCLVDVPCYRHRISPPLSALRCDRGTTVLADLTSEIVGKFLADCRGRESANRIWLPPGDLHHGRHGEAFRRRQLPLKAAPSWSVRVSAASGVRLGWETSGRGLHISLWNCARHGFEQFCAAKAPSLVKPSPPPS